MNPTVILCRHGNTFAKGERVVMVGAREDLPLTDEGLEQARALGKVLKDAGICIDRVLSGPLRRTKVFAEQLMGEAMYAASLSIDPRLMELDYGAWSGLSDEEIREQYGSEALLRWQEASERPEGVGFAPSAEQVRADVNGLLAELFASGGMSLVVSSNGRLREFGRACRASAERTSSFKMRTGSASVIECKDGAWSIRAWDLRPDALARFYAEV
jgi:broad specificity phosphatase PhoE